MLFRRYSEAFRDFFIYTYLFFCWKFPNSYGAPIIACWAPSPLMQGSNHLKCIHPSPSRILFQVFLSTFQMALCMSLVIERSRALYVVEKCCNYVTPSLTPLILFYCIEPLKEPACQNHTYSTCDPESGNYFFIERSHFGRRALTTCLTVQQWAPPWLGSPSQEALALSSLPSPRRR